jgi:hypothetical protein
LTLRLAVLREYRIRVPLAEALPRDIGRMSVASMWTTSPRAIRASTQALTVRVKICRNNSAPQRSRMRVSDEWSGRASCSP